jgi:hypothetical protein
VARQFRQFGILYVRHGKAMRGSPPQRRSVLTVPDFDWVCDCLQQWIEDVRPRYAPARSTDQWPSESGGMITADAISRAFNVIRREAGLDEPTGYGQQAGWLFLSDRFGRLFLRLRLQTLQGFFGP